MSARYSERLTRRQLARLSNRQRAAYDLLSYGARGPAERARLKIELGLRRSRVETVALACELLEAGRTRLEAATMIGIGADYLDRILEGASTPRNRP